MAKDRCSLLTNVLQQKKAARRLEEAFENQEVLKATVTQVLDRRLKRCC